ncbi:penicillin-binding protein 1B [Aliagarivorans marinus]|uniref:penicillin-binding protein 1B n=1 Tax=Aliagarivorans marinus TaxID=561965 RepID=UPI0004075DF8|nr:penicillin-binding protein 1B [Aliagarivorans marinus]
MSAAKKGRNTKATTKAKAKPRKPSKVRSSKGRSRKSAKAASPLWRKALVLGAKLGIGVLAVLLLWGVYLDSKIQQRFAGDKWELPAAVYGRELQLYPGLRMTRQELQDELAQLNYRKVKRAQRAGEYAVSSTRIELVRRNFDFADGGEPELPLLLTFNGQRLAQIQHRDSAEELAQTRLDPMLLGRINVSDQEDRILVRLEDVPQQLIDALLLTEDRDFYQHDGVSPTAILRALVVNLRAGRTVQGGSTLTQQLAKNFFLTRERTLWRKAQEAYIAVLMELRFSKDELLEAYLNEVYLGQNGSNGVYGIGLASYFYFGVPVSDLRVEQIATLVGLVKGPSYYDPWRHGERALKRRDLILWLLVEHELLSSDDYQRATAQELGVIRRGSMGYQKLPGFMTLVQRELKQYASGWQQYNGVKIFTTLDPRSQRHAQQAASTVLTELDKSKPELETAMVVSERYSGAIRALVGGRNEALRGFNRALDARRPIGSLVKPFVYLSAFEEGHHLGELLDDSPLTLTLDDGNQWQPNNYDREFRGPVMLYRALADSLNVPTVRLGMEVGLNSVINTLHLAGLEQELKPFPALLLGSTSLSPYQVAQIYQTLGGDGEFRRLYAVEQVHDGQGNSLYKAKVQAQRRWSEMANYLTLYSMQEATRSGTAQSLRWRVPKVALAGKTGTTNDLRDSWFVGIDEREIVTTWVGRDDNQSAGVTGSSAALPVYAAYLQKSYPQSLRPLQPDALAWVNVSQKTGRVTAADCGNVVLLPAHQQMTTEVDSCFREQTRKAGNWLQRIFN